MLRFVGSRRRVIAARAYGAFALAMVGWVALAARPACADRAILTPSSTNLAPSQASAEDIYGLDRKPTNNLWIDGGFQYVEIEGAQLQQRGRQASVLSAQVEILPETFATPSVAAGVRDIFDTTRSFGSMGYTGRSAYVVAGKTLFDTQTSPNPVRNVTLTLGIGTGVTNGLFGSASADLGFGFRQTIEYDGRGLNYRLFHRIAKIARIEFERIHGANYLGLEIATPVPD